MFARFVAAFVLMLLFIGERGSVRWTLRLVHRRMWQAQRSAQKSAQKIIELMRVDPSITIADLVQSVGINDRPIKKQIEKLKIQGRIRRIGPDKGGHWEVVE